MLVAIGLGCLRKEGGSIDTSLLVATTAVLHGLNGVCPLNDAFPADRCLRIGGYGLVLVSAFLWVLTAHIRDGLVPLCEKPLTSLRVSF